MRYLACVFAGLFTYSRRTYDNSKGKIMLAECDSSGAASASQKPAAPGKRFAVNPAEKPRLTRDRKIFRLTIFGEREAKKSLIAAMRETMIQIATFALCMGCCQASRARVCARV
jgi:hypothetical protein